MIVAVKVQRGGMLFATAWYFDTSVRVLCGSLGHLPYCIAAAFAKEGPTLHPDLLLAEARRALRAALVPA